MTDGEHPLCFNLSWEPKHQTERLRAQLRGLTAKYALELL